MANIEINIAVTEDESRSWVYRDIDASMSLDSVKRDIASHYDESAINNSLANLVRIRQGERQFNMQYGIDIEQFLYEPINTATARSIGDRIRSAIKRWEPRISLKNVNIVPDIANNEYMITVTYVIPLLSNEEYEMQYSLSGAA
jgi:phage baseplate assembly protein W